MTAAWLTTRTVLRPERVDNFRTVVLERPALIRREAQWVGSRQAFALANHPRAYPTTVPLLVQRRHR